MTRDPSRLLRPRSIAFLGGSQMAGPVAACRRAGFAGRVGVVNPTRSEVGGVPCVPDLGALDEPPDAALVGLAPERAVEAVAALARMGAGGAVVMASGFAEAGPSGRARQDALVRAAGDMPVLGPNCMGLLNLFDGAAIWGDDAPMERPGARGAAIVSQSGAMLIGIAGVEQAFPLGYAVSTGNQAVVDMADCIRAVRADERVAAIGLYLEGIEDGAALGAACLDARTRGVPVVALKGGDGAAGAPAAVGHTAAMVVERDLWGAFRNRFGLAEVGSPKALVEALKLLTVGGRPRGDRLALASYSGGMNGLAATRAAASGLRLPEPVAHARLRGLLPDTVALANPLDLDIPFRSSTGLSMRDAPAVGEALALFAEGIADQLVFLIDVPRGSGGAPDPVWEESLDALVHVRDRLGLPVAVAGILPEGLGPDLRARLQARGVAALCGLPEAMEAIAAAARLATPPDAAGRALLRGPAPRAAAIWDETRSKAALAARGVVCPPNEVAAPEAAGDAARRIGFPVAVKVLGPIPHKARLGGVRLHVGSPDEAVRAAHEVATATGRAPAHVLVERMVADPRAEVIVGVKRDPALGLALMIGHGGLRVEEVARYETMLLPLVEAELDGAMNQLGLGGHDALRGAVRAVAAFAAERRAELVTLDVNPVILTADGGAVAADAMIVAAAPEGRASTDQEVP